MKNLTIKIKLLSDALIGSGEGFGAIIDADIVFDDLGIPYIPARRIKGCLRESAEEVSEMLKTSDITIKSVSDVFGTGEKLSSFTFNNLTIEGYEENRQWLGYFIEEYKNIISRDAILDTFTMIRHQTAIDEDGVAREHSLRTIRVLKKGEVFSGDIKAEDGDAIKLLSFACLNLRRLGTKRNRGFGEIECKLFDDKGEVSYLSELEELCKS